MIGKTNAAVGGIQLDRVALNLYPTKRAYLLDDAIDLSGATVTATYSNGATRTVTDSELAASPPTAEKGLTGYVITLTEFGVTRATLIKISIGPVKNADPQLVMTGSLPVDVNMAVNAEYPWAHNFGKSVIGYYAFVAGNSGTETANVSNLSLTVRRAGVLGFDWRVSTRNSGNYKLCYQVNTPITVENAGSLTHIQGNKTWIHASVVITQAMLSSGTATVYIAYVRGGVLVSNLNYGAIANVNFSVT